MKGQGGFTLVEMLVALFIFGIISASGVLVLTFGLQAKERSAVVVERLKTFQLARAVLKSDLGQLVERPARGPLGGGLVFRGGVARGKVPVLAFVRSGWDNPYAAEDRSALQYVEYALEDGVLLRRSRVRVDAAADTPERSRPVLSGVTSFSIAFFDGVQWSDSWQSVSGRGIGLPKVVAIEAEIEGLGEIRQLFMTPAVT